MQGNGLLKFAPSKQRLLLDVMNAGAIRTWHRHPQEESFRKGCLKADLRQAPTASRSLEFALFEFLSM